MRVRVLAVLCSSWACALAAGLLTAAASRQETAEGLSVVVTPAATGRQLVRTSLPLPRGFLREGHALEIRREMRGRADDESHPVRAEVRPLSWHTATNGELQSVRRALVTFPYSFRTAQPMRFTLRPAGLNEGRAPPRPVTVVISGDSVSLSWKQGWRVVLRPLAPARACTEVPRLEVVENNGFYLWERWHFPDALWPRIIEVRCDVLGGVAVVAHLQRNVPGDGFAPDFGWQVTMPASCITGLTSNVPVVVSGQPFRHSFAADRGECRNIGDVRDFVRLHRYTGERRYLDEAIRLFRELRGKLSTGDLFDQGGKPLDPDPPFIEDDQRGLTVGYAKPYIIGYALAGLPGLLAFAPDEPKLRETVRAVADFLADSQDPVGGWRYPHPRSSAVIMSQALEHAWQLTQAARALGPDEPWLDAIEATLRQRLHGWRRTGQMFSGLDGWEMATGTVKDRKELQDLYRKPSDRDARRDYAEGRASFGSAPPEGIVYYSEVLEYYLQHRPAARLLAGPEPDDPLGQVVNRLPQERK